MEYSKTFEATLDNTVSHIAPEFYPPQKWQKELLYQPVQQSEVEEGVIIPGKMRHPTVLDSTRQVCVDGVYILYTTDSRHTGMVPSRPIVLAKREKTFVFEYTRNNSLGKRGYIH